MDDDAHTGRHSLEMQTRLLAEQVKGVYLVVRMVVVFSPILSVFAVIALWNTADHGLLLIWMAVQLLHSLLFELFRRNYSRHDQLWENQSWLKQQHLILFIMGTSAGLLYGLCVPLFWDEAALESVVILCLMLTGLNVAPFIGNAISYPIYFWTPLLSIGPIIVKCILLGDYFWLIAFLEFMAIVAYLLYAKLLSEMFHDNFWLRFQNEMLVQSLREEKEQVEKASRAKTRFLASASHDLRQPLQAQRLYVEAMIDQLESGVVAELGKKVIYSQQAMQKMLDALLDLSKLDADMMTPLFADLPLKQLFSSMEQEFSSQAEIKGLQLHIHWPLDDATVRSDAGMLESILRNLIANAIRYTDEGSVMLAARRRGSQWQIEVRDSGKGIPTDQQQEVFEEFRQLDNPERDREKGLGLGLSIVRRLAQLLDHALSLSSQPESGSVFALKIPVGLFPADECLMPKNGETADLSGYRILVVDDDSAIRDGLTAALELSGCQVVQAANRAEAVALLMQQRPDAMIVDYRLARDDDGIQVIEHLNRSVSEDIPALLLTGDTAPNVLKKIEQSGILLLHKPIASRTLIRRLAEVLEYREVS